MIYTEDLTRNYQVGKNTVKAVRGMNLQIEKGQIVALLGPNGAGKSTLFRMLTTLLSPTSGSAVVAGHDIATDPEKVRQSIGLVGQEHGAAPNHLVGEELADHARCYGLSRKEAETRADELLNQLDLSGLSDRAAQNLSGGQKRRLDIAMGLAAKPELLFLDEPSTGLDPQNRANLSEVIRSLRNDVDTTIVFSTHYMDEANALADRVVVIDHGTIIADGTPKELIKKLAEDVITITLAIHNQIPQAKKVISEAVMSGADTEQVDVIGNNITVKTPNGRSLLSKIAILLNNAEIQIEGCDVRTGTLDDVFLALTGRNLRDVTVNQQPDNTKGHL